MVKFASFFSLCVLILGCNNGKTVHGISPYEGIEAVSDFAPELWINRNTYKGSFSDDYKTFYFFRKVSPEAEKYVPYQSSYVDGKWDEPKTMAHYEKEHSYTYQVKIPNTNKLVFISNKKTVQDTTQKPNYNFWEIELANNKDTKPQELGYKNVIYNYNSQPCVTNNGTLFFTSDLPDWSATFSYKMEFQDGKYEEPKLFEPVNGWRQNSDWTVYEFCMAPNESYMIVSIRDNSEEEPSVDLYISHLKGDEWTEPRKLGKDINTNETENFPTITRDGKFLLFTRAFSEFKIVSIDQLNNN